MICLYGASGHAKVIIEILEQQGTTIVGLIDSNPNIKSLLEYPVYQNLNSSEIECRQLIISIGDNFIRKAKALEMDADFGTAIHPSANISLRSNVGEGAVIMAGVAVNSCVSVGKHVILNTNCSIDHDCEIGDYVHISPNAALAGNVKVGEGSHIGIGVAIKQGINIGKWATIGAGSVIVKDVPDFAVMVGNPGKIIRYNNYVLNT
jgi:sugar O-acyltransferase (sialic acid O-acetyltransferase NeuD family)